VQDRGHREIEHLVEVTVIDITSPINRNQVTAHDIVEVGIEMSILQETEIAFELTFSQERRAEALNWHVGEDIELVEHNTVLLAQHPLVVRFQRSLRRRAQWPLRIVNEGECTCWIEPVSDRIEAQACGDRGLEHALSVLSFDMVLQITSH